ncbi:hypothetical protein HDU76_005728 [Blyttiomyces sp. JEL0837]|nr:hypothetical protein HDU76_005728 [Blyttiomyces sp. JEL0837]
MAIDQSQLSPSLANLPLETIIHIFHCLNISKTSYFALIRVCKPFKNAMTLIPKSIELQIFVKTASLSAPIALPSVDRTCEWHWQSLPSTLESSMLTRKTKRSLLLGKCRFDLHLHDDAVITSEGDELLKYRQWHAAEKIFGSKKASMGLQHCRLTVLMASIDLIFKYSATCGKLEANHDRGVLTLLKVCKPQELSITWHPALPKRIYGVERLLLSQNQGKTPLMDFSSLRGAGPCFYHLELIDDGRDAESDNEIRSFESLRGINALKTLRTLVIHAGVLSNVQENMQYLALPNLVELKVHELDITIFVAVLRNCPSLKILSGIQSNPRSNPDFLLQCEHACKGPDGVILRKRFQQVQQRV